MLERFPLLTLILIPVGLIAAIVVFTWLWFGVGLIWTALIAIGALLALPWLVTHRPRFLRHG